MHLTTFPDAASFLSVTQAALEANEVANNLMLGIALRLQRHPETAEQPPYFAAVQDEGGLVGAAVMTPPYSVIVHAERDDAQLAFTCIAHDLQMKPWPVSGVIGPNVAADEFLEVWQRFAGATVKRLTRERVFQLDRVIEPRRPYGSFRAAGEDDIPLVVAWLDAFHREALPDHPHSDWLALARRRVGDGDVFLWLDADKPVSLAARSRATSHARCVGPVYTPMEMRGKGYASAVTAKLSQVILDSGYTRAMLFTDLSNPTSNSIYQKIGYKPVCDYNEYLFD